MANSPRGSRRRVASSSKAPKHAARPRRLARSPRARFASTWTPRRAWRSQSIPPSCSAAPPPAPHRRVVTRARDLEPRAARDRRPRSAVPVHHDGLGSANRRHHPAYRRRADHPASDAPDEGRRAGRAGQPCSRTLGRGCALRSSDDPRVCARHQVPAVGDGPERLCRG